MKKFLSWIKHIKEILLDFGLGCAKDSYRKIKEDMVKREMQERIRSEKIGRILKDPALHDTFLQLNVRPFSWRERNAWKRRQRSLKRQYLRAKWIVELQRQEKGEWKKSDQQEDEDYEAMARKIEEHAWPLANRVSTLDQKIYPTKKFLFEFYAVMLIVLIVILLIGVSANYFLTADTIDYLYMSILTFIVIALEHLFDFYNLLNTVVFAPDFYISVLIAEDWERIIAEYVIQREEEDWEKMWKIRIWLEDYFLDKVILVVQSEVWQYLRLWHAAGWQMFSIFNMIASSYLDFLKGGFPFLELVHYSLVWVILGLSILLDLLKYLLVGTICIIWWLIERHIWYNLVEIYINFGLHYFVEHVCFWVSKINYKLTSNYEMLKVIEHSIWWHWRMLLCMFKAIIIIMPNIWYYSIVGLRELYLEIFYWPFIYFPVFIKDAPGLISYIVETFNTLIAIISYWLIWNFETFKVNSLLGNLVLDSLRYCSYGVRYLFLCYQDFGIFLQLELGGGKLRLGDVRHMRTVSNTRFLMNAHLYDWSESLARRTKARGIRIKHRLASLPRYKYKSIIREGGLFTPNYNMFWNLPREYYDMYNAFVAYSRKERMEYNKWLTLNYKKSVRFIKETVGPSFARANGRIVYDWNKWAKIPILVDKRDGYWEFLYKSRLNPWEKLISGQYKFRTWRDTYPRHYTLLDRTYRADLKSSRLEKFIETFPIAIAVFEFWVGILILIFFNKYARKNLNDALQTQELNNTLWGWFGWQPKLEVEWYQGGVHAWIEQEEDWEEAFVSDLEDKDIEQQFTTEDYWKYFNWQDWKNEERFMSKQQRIAWYKEKRYMRYKGIIRGKTEHEGLDIEDYVDLAMLIEDYIEEICKLNGVNVYLDFQKKREIFDDFEKAYEFLRSEKQLNRYDVQLIDKLCKELMDKLDQFIDKHKDPIERRKSVTREIWEGDPQTKAAVKGWFALFFDLVFVLIICVFTIKSLDSAAIGEWLPQWMEDSFLMVEEVLRVKIGTWIGNGIAEYFRMHNSFWLYVDYGREVIFNPYMPGYDPYRLGGAMDEHAKSHRAIINVLLKISTNIYNYIFGIDERYDDLVADQIRATKEMVRRNKENS
jgi:hypothetical protein